MPQEGKDVFKRPGYVCDVLPADSYIRMFEMEYAFRQNRVGNFANLFHLLNKEIQKVVDLVQFYGEDDGLRKVS